MSNSIENGETVKTRNIRRQLDASRDFERPGPTRTRYVICCTHRSGSNMLSETLYRTGLAGDPIEYINQDFVREYGRQKGTRNFTFHDLIADMETRRTSPNGVFGMNVKYDQMETLFRRMPNPMVTYIDNADHVLFLYRRDRLQQAVSGYKARQRGAFNVPVDDAEGAPDHDSVPFEPAGIAWFLNLNLRVEKKWRELLDRRGVSWEALAYEDLMADYTGTVRRVLDRLGVAADAADIPEPPTIRMRDATDAELRRRFLEHLSVDAATEGETDETG